MSFLEARKEMLKDHPEFKFDFSSQKMLKESFDRLSERQSARLKAKSLIDLHGKFSQFYKLRVPIHPRNLAQMIHPYQGYMASFEEGTTFDWKDL